ncbi:hypothetical protein PO869_14395 [[Ruminococcus] gnavus]|uniref:Uncharacterized protein n=1 Tax=Mediterraneibacter gnavus TaxID=33038 RepID=A0AAW6K3Q2_MEDGN|nr:hypothetical protein [Mediterraneibacter gnavus]MDB8697681.1 hypothetical protein [Mediterraneibacter gnavus]MDC6141177.1 hypothetical protein [Mediterraneibacter gnavus]MDE1204743.1 hypothetical protein [Mediterraneibacter gnavus]
MKYCKAAGTPILSMEAACSDIKKRMASKLSAGCPANQASSTS